MCPVKTSRVTRLALPRSSPPPVPPSAAQQGLMYTGFTTQRQWHVTVLRDLRRAQSEPLLALLFWRSSHSDDWPLQLSASLAANSWSAVRDLRVSATSFLRLSTSASRLPCWVSFVSIVAVKVAISSSFAAMSPAWWPCGPLPPFGRPSTASECQRSRRSVVRTSDWHRAPRKKTAWNDHHRKPCSSSIRANGYVNRKQHIWLPHKWNHGYFCRLPAPVFSPL